MKPVRDEMRVNREISRHDAPAHPALHVCKLYHSMFDSFEHIRLNHRHSDEVVKGLRLIARAVCSCDEAPYLLVHMHGTQTLEILLRCLSNIDEEVLLSGCCALYALIQRSPPALDARTAALPPEEWRGGARRMVDIQ